MPFYHRMFEDIGEFREALDVLPESSDGFSILIAPSSNSDPGASLDSLKQTLFSIHDGGVSLEDRRLILAESRSIEKFHFLYFKGFCEVLSGDPEKDYETLKDVLRNRNRLLTFVLDLKTREEDSAFDSLAGISEISFLGGVSLDFVKVDLSFFFRSSGSGSSEIHPDSSVRANTSRGRIALLLEEDFKFDYFSHASKFCYSDEKFLKVLGREAEVGYELLVESDGREQLLERGFERMYIPLRSVKEYFRESGSEGPGRSGRIIFITEPLLELLGECENPCITVDSVKVKPHFVKAFFSEAALFSLEVLRK